MVSIAKEHANQVIIVDDGSYDGTAKEARNAGALVIEHEINKGAGAATKTSFDFARQSSAQVLVTLDGDGQHDPKEIPQILLPILENKADLVIGSRFMNNHKNMPGHRMLGNKIITWLYNVGARQKISDTQSCFRAYGEKALCSLDITERGFGFSTELLIQARQKGLTIVEVPITCIYNTSSHTSNPLIQGFCVAFSVVKIRLRNYIQRLIEGK